MEHTLPAPSNGYAAACVHPELSNVENPPGAIEEHRTYGPRPQPRSQPSIPYRPVWIQLGEGKKVNELFLKRTAEQW